VTHLHELKVGKLEQRGRPMLKIKDHLIKTIKNNHTKEVQKKRLRRKRKLLKPTVMAQQDIGLKMVLIKEKF
jgi:hypothetical protein